MTSEKDRYALPNWLVCPPRGFHLDVFKEKKLIQKLLVDEKGHYYFGRNPVDSDFVVEHGTYYPLKLIFPPNLPTYIHTTASCSRVHAVLLYHKALKRFAIVDLESSHGTFVENSRIPACSPIFLEPNQCFHFGASTRKYFLREKKVPNDSQDDEVEVERGFSASQNELDSVTEANTANNRRIPTIPQTLNEARRKLRPRPKVAFNDEEEIINPEDVDPAVGRFRNMVRTAVIPVSTTHRRQRDSEDQLFDFYAPSEPKKKKVASPTTTLPSNERFTSITLGSLSLNAAPDLDLYTPSLPPPKSGTSIETSKFGSSAPRAKLFLGVGNTAAESEECPSKKKYAKEAWPRDLRRRSGSGVF